jgi:hypothetical protein
MGQTEDELKKELERVLQEEEMIQRDNPITRKSKDEEDD